MFGQQGLQHRVVGIEQALVAQAHNQQIHILAAAGGAPGPAHPTLLIEQIGNQPFELGGVLDLVLGLAEHQPKQAMLFAEMLQDAAVLAFQLHTVFICQSAPLVPPWYGRLLVPWWLGLLVGELEEQQHAELFEVVAVGDAVVAEDGSVAPNLLDDAVGFGAAASMAVEATPGLRRCRALRSRRCRDRERRHGYSRCPGTTPDTAAADGLL